MKYCTKCRCGGRIKAFERIDTEEYAQYVCPNPVCSNYRTVFAEERIVLAGSAEKDEIKQSA